MVYRPRVLTLAPGCDALRNRSNTNFGSDTRLGIDGMLGMMVPGKTVRFAELEFNRHPKIQLNPVSNHHPAF